MALRHRKEKKNKIFLTYFLVVFFLLITFLFTKKAFSPNAKLASFDQTGVEFYIPVTNYFSSKEDVTLPELKNQKTKLFFEKGEKENILKYLGDSFVDVSEKSKEDLEELKEDEIAIVRWSSVGVRQKSLSFEGNLFWETKDPEKYALKSEIKKQANSEVFNPAKVTKVTAMGDVMLSRNVAAKISKKGILYPWAKTKDRTANADITFANLEVPLSDLRPAPTTGMSFIAPTKNTEGLLAAGIDVVSVANNHTANFGQAAFLDNLSTLKNGNVLACGGGRSEKEARTPKIIVENGIKFAFLCYNSITGGLHAEGGNPGVPPLKIEPWYRDSKSDITNLETDIREAKKTADVVIVSPHWGVEYKSNPNNSQRMVAKAAILAGADLILGTHPHVVQGSEIIDRRYVTYSLGNFIFDQEWSQETKEGTMLENYFYGNKHIFARIVPIEIKDYSQPEFLSQEKARSVIERIKKNSFGF